MPQRAKVSGCGRTHTQSLLLIFFSTCSLSIYFPLRAHTYIHIYIRRILSRGCALNGFSVCETMHASIHRRAFSHQPTQALAIPLHTLLNSFALQSLYKLDFWCAVCGPFSSSSRLGACVCVRFFFLFCSSDIPWHLPFCARRAQHLKCNNNNNKSENKHKQQRQQQQQKCAGYEQWEIASHFATPKRSSKAGLSLLILCSACTLPSLPWNECIA